MNKKKVWLRKWRWVFSIDRQKIQFRDFESQDWKLFQHWMDEPHVCRAWFQDYIKDLEFARHEIILLEGEAIGWFQSFPLKEEKLGFWPTIDHHSVAVRLLIGDINLIDQGIGAQALGIKSEELFQNSSTHRLLADPLMGNENAIRMFLKSGFLCAQMFYRQSMQFQLMEKQRI